MQEPLHLSQQLIRPWLPLSGVGYATNVVRIARPSLSERGEGGDFALLPTGLPS